MPRALTVHVLSLCKMCSFDGDCAIAWQAEEEDEEEDEDLELSLLGFHTVVTFAWLAFMGRWFNAEERWGRY